MPQPRDFRRKRLLRYQDARLELVPQVNAQFVRKSTSPNHKWLRLGVGITLTLGAFPRGWL